MSDFNINLQQVSSFKRVPLIKERIFFKIKSLVFYMKHCTLKMARHPSTYKIPWLKHMHVFQMF